MVVVGWLLFVVFLTTSNNKQKKRQPTINKQINKN
jgi:hypothetical protein